MHYIRGKGDALATLRLKICDPTRLFFKIDALLAVQLL
jgi:hypothetical protein